MLRLFPGVNYGVFTMIKVQNSRSNLKNTNSTNEINYHKSKSQISKLTEARNIQFTALLLVDYYIPLFGQL